MNRMSIYTISCLVIVLLAACKGTHAAPASPASDEPGVTQTANPSNAPRAAPTGTSAGEPAAEAEVRSQVERFGKQIQLVSLLSPNARQDIDQYYSNYVSPALLKTWMSDVSKAPGRVVSSPWPDRIEIVHLAEEGPGRYAVTGFIVEVTSREVAEGGNPARIPVRMILEKSQGRWMITEYAEER